MQGRFIYKDATITTDAVSGHMDDDGDTAVADVRDLTAISIYLNQIVDDSNVTLTVEKSIDGTNFALVVQKAQSDFPAGANKSIEVTLSDANGMPTAAQMIRVTVSNHTGTGEYTVTVGGTQRDGYR